VTQYIAKVIILEPQKAGLKYKGGVDRMD